MMHRASTTEEKAFIVGYLAAKIGSTPQSLVGQMPFEAAIMSRAGRPMGAILYVNYRTHSVEMMAAGEPGWITRANIQAALHYPFCHLGCWTVITMVNRSNAESRELQRRLGFTELCVIETGMGKSNDTILYSMSRDKCLWLSRDSNQVAA